MNVVDRVGSERDVDVGRRWGTIERRGLHACMRRASLCRAPEDHVPCKDSPEYPVTRVQSVGLGLLLIISRVEFWSNPSPGKDALPMRGCKAFRRTQGLLEAWRPLLRKLCSAVASLPGSALMTWQVCGGTDGVHPGGQGLCLYAAVVGV